MEKKANKIECIPAFERFDRTLEKTDKLTITVLKGHLLIEEQLLRLLASVANYPKGVDEANLRFVQLALLVEAFFRNDRNIPVWKALRNLNSLRNQLAHNLEPKELEARVTTFVSVIIPPPKSGHWSRRQLQGVLNQALGFIFGFLLTLQPLALRVRKSC